MGRAIRDGDAGTTGDAVTSGGRYEGCTKRNTEACAVQIIVRPGLPLKASILGYYLSGLMPEGAAAWLETRNFNAN